MSHAKWKMILSEFVMTHTLGSRPIDLAYFAEVSVTTTSGAIWWKTSTVRRQIHREYAGHWYFVDNGEFTPESQAETLERAWVATDRLANK